MFEPAVGPVTAMVRWYSPGPPNSGRTLHRLGDRCVPSRRCAGAGRGPPLPAVGLTAGETRHPRPGRRVRVVAARLADRVCSRVDAGSGGSQCVVVTRCSSRFKHHCATVRSLVPPGLRTALRPCVRAGGATGLSVDGVVRPAGPLAPGPVEWARRRWCDPSPRGARPSSGPSSSRVARCGVSSSCGPPAPLESSGYPPAGTVSCIEVDKRGL